MDKLLNFYDEISSLFGRRINKMDGALIEENFHTLTAGQKTQLRALLDELMGDRNRLFPDGFGADSVDISAIPNVTLPRWGGGGQNASDKDPEPATAASRNSIAVEQECTNAFWADRRYGNGRLVRQFVVAEQGAEYGPITVVYADYAQKLLQEGDRLWSGRAKRLPARTVIRKRAALLHAFRVFQMQVGPNFEKLAPELAVALQQLDRKVEEGGGNTGVAGNGRVTVRSPRGGMRRAKGSAKKSAKL